MARSLRESAGGLRTFVFLVYIAALVGLLVAQTWLNVQEAACPESSSAIKGAVTASPGPSPLMIRTLAPSRE